ncbi:MAG: hypothetical protein KIS66_16455 [Fimbriimonadaceae bacterium]|nr:hypothetical protein [Fimbriimonadaceae bacterium]
MVASRSFAPSDVRVVEDGILDGPTNMRSDLALLEDLRDCAVSARVYFWDGPWVSLGRYQVPERDLSPDCAVPWVRRPTGGKGVLHGHDATIGLVARLDALLPDLPFARRERAVKRAYRALAAPLVRALNACGLPAVLAETTDFVGRGGRTADCFNHVSPNDMVDPRTGLKVCGCALLMRPTAVLVQASIPCGEPLVDPGTVFPSARRQPSANWNTGLLVESLWQALVEGTR